MDPLTPSSEERLLALLDRYLAGECTSAEVEEVRAWLSAASDNRSILKEVERIRLVAGTRPPNRSAEAAWQNAIAELSLDSSRSRAPVRVIPLSRPLHSESRKRRMGQYAVAAGLILAVGAGAVFSFNKSPRTVVAEIPERQFSTAPGQRAIVELPDGSQMTLGPQSSVRLASSFDRGTRNVELVGQAFFRVRHDPKRRFLVRTLSGIVEDLGTEFVVNAYPESHGTQVVVAHGKVALQGTPLAQGQMGRVDRSGRVAVTSGVNVQLYTGWIDGSLSFEDAPFGEASTTLGRWFAVDIKVADPKLAALPLTATFKSESIDEVLQILDLTLGLTHRKTGRSITFYPVDRTSAPLNRHPNP